MVFSRLPLVTPRSICSKPGALAAALVLAALALLPHAAAADDRDALERGRTAGRGVLIVRDPIACGIALLRARCAAAVDAFLQRHGQADADYKTVPRIGPHPATGLRAFIAGDHDAMDFALEWFNTAQSTEQYPNSQCGRFANCIMSDRIQGLFKKPDGLECAERNPVSLVKSKEID